LANAEVARAAACAVDATRRGLPTDRANDIALSGAASVTGAQLGALATGGDEQHLDVVLRG
jgi:hypothetical protein